MIASFAAATGALVMDTFRESLSRKIFWGFFGCSTVLMLLFLLVLNVDIVEGGVAAITIFGQDFTGGQGAALGQVVNLVLGGVSVFLFTAGLFFSVFASAGLIPTVFEPGRIELLLSKPVGRSHLLFGKFLGTLAVIGSNLFYLIFGAWAILGLKTGIWQAGFLASASLAVFAFGVLLTVVLFVSVISHSAVLATMVTYFVMLLSGIFSQHENIGPYFNSQWPRDLVTGLYYVFPKLPGIGDMARLAFMGKEIETWMPLVTSGLFAAVMLVASVVVFARKDY